MRQKGGRCPRGSRDGRLNGFPVFAGRGKNYAKMMPEDLN